MTSGATQLMVTVERVEEEVKTKLCGVQSSILRSGTIRIDQMFMQLNDLISNL